MELVWNAIDADALDIRVVLKANEAGGITEVEVLDDGHGIDLATAEESFVALGRSWKDGGARSRNLGRALHGKEGRGRFKLFRHGGVARWRSVAEQDGERRAVVITLRDGDDAIEIEDGGPSTAPLGTRVTLSAFGTPPKGLTGNSARDRLLSNFVLPIESHGLRLSYNGELIDPEVVQASRDELEADAGPLGVQELTVIEWRRAIGQHDLHLCDADGAVLGRVASQVGTSGVHFSAYVRWAGFAGAQLEVIELDAGEPAAVIGAARKRLERHFDEIRAQRRRKVIADWRQEGVYPFRDGPADTGARVAQETSDVVALEAAETVNRSNRVGKRLALRLLREALEHNPGQVHHVLAEVLSLDKERLADLTRLLERTGLAKMISASTAITDRLDFLEALAQLTSDPDLRDEVQEREHLHRLLEEEAWVFGEEYALMVSEAGLTQVLAQHIGHLKRDQLAPGPVRDADGRLRRVDLMLGAVAPHTTGAST